MKIIKGSQHQYVIKNLVGKCEKIKIYNAQNILTNQEVSVAIINDPTWRQIHNFVTLKVMQLPKTINIIDICHTDQLIVIMQKAQFFILSEYMVLEISEVIKVLHANSMVHGKLKVEDFAISDGQLVLWKLGIAGDAPELKYNEPYTTAVDIWSLGRIWFELCTAKTYNSLDLSILCKSGLDYNQLECMKAMLNSDFLLRPSINEVIRVLMGKGFITQLPEYNQLWINEQLKEYNIALKELTVNKLQQQNILQEQLIHNSDVYNQIAQKAIEQKQIDLQQASEQIHFERQKASSIQFNKKILDEEAAQKLSKSIIQIDQKMEQKIKEFIIDDPSFQLLEEQFQLAVDQLRQEYGKKIQNSHKQITIINTQTLLISNQTNQIYNIIQQYRILHEEKKGLEIQIQQQEKNKLTDKQITYLGFSRIQIHDQKIKSKIEELIIRNRDIETEIQNYLLNYYRENIRMVQL